MRFTANMKGGTQERIAALQIFRDDPQISILLLDAVGAVGLDLSFVSHIFLLDPIWDKSLEDQVISRAHRLGAKRSITVEKLIARGTVEQMMEALARDSDADGDSSHDGLAGARGEVPAGQGSASGDAREGSANGGGGGGGGGLNRRHRGDEIKKIRETNKIRTILTGLKALDYDPHAEREREELSDSLATPHVHSCAAASAAPTQRAQPLDEVLSDLAPAPPPRANRPPPSGFVAAGSFQGSKPGYVFKDGQHGLGYYIDCPSVGVARHPLPERPPPPLSPPRALRPPCASMAGGYVDAAHREDGARATKRVRFHMT
jgi:hypothetical protein